MSISSFKQKKEKLRALGKKKKKKNQNPTEICPQIACLWNLGRLKFFVYDFIAGDKLII